MRNTLHDEKRRRKTVHTQFSRSTSVKQLRRVQRFSTHLISVLCVHSQNRRVVVSYPRALEMLLVEAASCEWEGTPWKRSWKHFRDDETGKFIKLLSSSRVSEFSELSNVIWKSTKKKNELLGRSNKQNSALEDERKLSTFFVCCVQFQENRVLLSFQFLIFYVIPLAHFFFSFVEFFEKPAQFASLSRKCCE